MISPEQLAELQATIQRLREEKAKLEIQADAKLQRLYDEKVSLQNTCTNMQRKSVDSINEVARYTREIQEYKRKNEVLNALLNEERKEWASRIKASEDAFFALSKRIREARDEITQLQDACAWCRTCKKAGLKVRARHSNGKNKFYCEEHWSDKCP